MKRVFLALALAPLALLASCGVKGEPDRPPPLFGEARARYEADQAEKAKAQAAGQTASGADSNRQRVEIPVAPRDPKPETGAAPPLAPVPVEPPSPAK